MKIMVRLTFVSMYLLSLWPAQAVEAIWINPDPSFYCATHVCCCTSRQACVKGCCCRPAADSEVPAHSESPELKRCSTDQATVRPAEISKDLITLPAVGTLALLQSIPLTDVPYYSFLRDILSPPPKSA